MMKRLLSGVVVAVVLGSFSMGALAQKPPAPARVKRADDCAEQRKRDPKATCELAIEGEELSGERIGPAGDQLLGRTERVHGSLIRYRTNMVDKMVAAADRF